MQGKRTKDSFTERVDILRPEHMNGYGRLFGGELMRQIDIIAGVAARRHAECEVTTVCVDSLVFEAPAFINDIIYMDARITYTGRTSMEVRVDTYVEPKKGVKTRVNRAYLVFVALDNETMRPVPVLPFLPETEEEITEWNAAKERKKIRESKKHD